MREKTFHVSEDSHSGFHRIKDQLGKKSIDEVCEYFIKKFPELRASAKPIVTKDRDLEEKYPCAMRFFHEGFYYCHRGQGLVRELLTLKICEHCKDRLDKEVFLQMQQELQKQKIHAMQLSLNLKIEDHKKKFYPACDPVERQGKYGVEIKSGRCPNKALKGEWHPPDVCDPSYPYLRRIPI